MYKSYSKPKPFGSRPHSSSGGFNRSRSSGTGSTSSSGRSGGYSSFGARRSYGGGRGGGFANKQVHVGTLLRLIESGSTQNSDASREKEHVVVNSFSDFKISDQLKATIKTHGYVTPTPVQDLAIPAILEGRDLIGMANTGTGKTAAFLIPLIEKVSQNRAEKVLIVTPTRELANQIYEEFRAFSGGLRIFAAVCIGGANMYVQRRELQRNPNFVIGTPGRIKDFINQRVLNLSDFGNVVLDETDRMVEIGFIEEIKFFISLLPKKRQSLFFSATITPKIREILTAFVSNPVTVNVKKQDTAKNVKQEVVRTRGAQKIDLLQGMLTKQEFSKVLIFGKTKWGVQKLSEELIVRGFKAGAIHGDKRQNQRQFVLNQFKRNEINILLATDVASRGLDIKDVSHVINYELPESIDDYVHRIGRTGRADKSGVAITFVD